MKLTTRNHEAVIGRSDFYKVNPTEIEVQEGWNPRVSFDAIRLEELKESIKANGVLVPLRVKLNNDNKMILIDGERRLRATLAAISEGAEIVSVPAIVERKTMNELDMLLLSLTTNQGEPLTIMEEAQAIQKLVNWGMKHDEVARRLGKSVPTIYNRIKLLDASPELIEEMNEGNVSFTEVKEILKDSDGLESQKEKLEEVKEKKARRKAAGIKKAGAKELKSLLSESVEWLIEMNHEKIEQVIDLVTRINEALDE